MGRDYHLSGRALLVTALLLAGLSAPGAQAQTPAQPEAMDTALQRDAAEARQIAPAYADYMAGRADAAALAFTALARQGNRLAQFNLAVMHARGELSPADPALALALLHDAAEHGLVSAMVALGEAYEAGELTAKDLGASAAWYRRAADAGQNDAATAVATAYYLGRGVARDLGLAAHYYLQAANGGDVGAQYLYASMCEHGLGVPQDLRLARYWYQKAADNGDLGGAVKAVELRDATAEPTGNETGAASRR